MSFRYPEKCFREWDDYLPFTLHSCYHSDKIQYGLNCSAMTSAAARRWWVRAGGLEETSLKAVWRGRLLPQFPMQYCSDKCSSPVNVSTTMFFQVFPVKWLGSCLSSVCGSIQAAFISVLKKKGRRCVKTLSPPESLTLFSFFSLSKGYKTSYSCSSDFR